jgi:hypothetical protein
VRWELRLSVLDLIEKSVVIITHERIASSTHKIKGNSTCPVVGEFTVILLTLTSFRREEYGRSSIRTSYVCAI